MKDRLHERWRRSRLASGRRAGSWTRAENRRRHIRVLKDSWRFFAIMISVGAVLITGIALTTRGVFMRGLIVGAGSTAIFGGLAVMVMMVSGSAVTGMGAIAEQWTSSELQPLRRHGWRVANHFVLRTWDIDHVLVGERGVVAVETKWSGSGWDLIPPSLRVRDAIERIKRNAHDLALWHPVRRHGSPVVRPVLFLWTAGDINAPEQGAVMTLDGVTVVTGTKSAATWRKALESSEIVLTDDQVASVWSAFEKQAQTRDKLEVTEHPAPISYTAMYWNLVGVLFAMIASLWVTSTIARTGVWVFLVLQLVAVAAGLLVRRFEILRIPSLGWIVPSILGFAAAVVGVFQAVS